MKNVVLSFVLFGILSGQTGKISGLITASETNQPLIGVSVVVEGAGIGADSDQEGRYVILNILYEHPILAMRLLRSPIYRSVPA